MVQHRTDSIARADLCRAPACVCLCAAGCHAACVTGCESIRLANGVVVDRSDILACTTLQFGKDRFYSDRRCKDGYSPVPWFHFGCYVTGTARLEL